MPREAKHLTDANGRSTRLEDMVPDLGMRQALRTHLISGADVLSEDSPFRALLQASINDVLQAEMAVFQAEEAAAGTANKRNGFTPKTVRSAVGMLDIATPRDRQGNFEPQLIGKRVEQLHTGLDEQVLALYAQGNSVEDVRRLVKRLFCVELSAGAISEITDRVMPRVNAWRSRPLAACYPIVYLDAIFFQVRQDGRYAQRASYTCYGIDVRGQRDILGFYFEGTEGAHAWGRILQDLHDRGVEEILIVCVDGLRGFREAIEAVYPQAITQRCVVHAVRQVTRLVDDKDRRALHAGLRHVYAAATEELAEANWVEFRQTWASKYPRLIRDWEAVWPELVPYFGFGTDLRRMMYTTNPVEGVHRVVRKLVKSKAAWVSEEALVKQLWLSLMHNEKSWKRAALGWKSAQRELAERYGERFTRHLT